MGVMRSLLYMAVTAAALLLQCAPAVAQVDEVEALPEDRVISFDSKVHDFGDVLLSDGPLSCSFRFTNISPSPIIIHRVISSCGCTTPEWPKSPVMPRDTGSICVTFTNDQGAYPFDKTLTVYVSGVNRPVVLRVRGYVHERNRKLSDIYPCRAGHLAFRENTVSIGYIDQGKSKTDVITVANVSRQPLQVRPFATDKGLTVTFDVNPIPPQSTAKMTVTVDTKAFEGRKWGKQSFVTGFIAGKEQCRSAIAFTAFIKDNFDDYDDARVDRAASPVPDLSYFEFGRVSGGSTVDLSYRLTNTGAEPLVIHKIEADRPGVKFVGKCPVTLAPGASTVLKLKYDTSNASGETVVVLTLVTNSPAKPLLNLFATGTVMK